MSTIETQSIIKKTTSDITLANRWDHFLARFSVNRMGHCIEPGLYALGTPDASSPVFVSANYTLSFDALRSSLIGIDAYILVLDTKGVNVWCAAGKGTFGTEELVHRIKLCRLSEVVNHRKLIIPQLGATGVAAHLVKQCSGFKVEFGPVRASDLLQYLKTGKATLDMRRVYFGFWDRMVLIPVEFIGSLIPMLVLAIVFYFIGGYLSAAGVIAAFIAGTVLFPILLPWIPTSNFSTKGFIIGIWAALPFFFIVLMHYTEVELWRHLIWGFSYLLTLPPVTAFITLNFTGATTFTSKTGVKREMFRYIPIMAWMFASGMVITIGVTVFHYLGA